MLTLGSAPAGDIVATVYKDGSALYVEPLPPQSLTCLKPIGTVAARWRGSITVSPTSRPSSKPTPSGRTAPPSARTGSSSWDTCRHCGKKLEGSHSAPRSARNLFVGCFRPVPPQSIHVSGIVVIRVRVYSIVILARYDPPRHLPDQWRDSSAKVSISASILALVVISERARRKPHWPTLGA